MTPVTIGACLRTSVIQDHRDWLFDAPRDVELQDFSSYAQLTGDWRAVAQEARRQLDGHTGRLGIHGPFEGLDIDNKDPEVQPIITRRFLTALEACEVLGARQMVVHSPYTRWYKQNLLAKPGYAEQKLERIHRILGPVVRRAEDIGVTLVVENIQDADPWVRAEMAASFGSSAIKLSVDTGHAHLARRMSDAPPVDFFIRAAGADLSHVHVQDLDGYADRHWPPGDGDIAWRTVFEAIAECPSQPHVVLEVRSKDIPRGFGWLKAQGLVI